MTRGKIMRDTNAGPGIVFVNGEQKTFTLETHWKSGTPPKVGAVVEVELDDQGGVLAVTLVDETALAKEQAQKAMNFASENGKQYLGVVIARVGAPVLVSIGLLLIAWLFLSTITVQITPSKSQGFTFYDILKFLNSSGSAFESLQGLSRSASAGFYGFLMYVAALAPFAPHFHANKYLQLGYCAPLLYIVGVGLSVYLGIKRHVSDTQDMASEFLGRQAGSDMAEKMMSQMYSMMMQSISLGAGFYIAAAVAIYLAAIGIKKYLASTATV